MSNKDSFLSKSQKSLLKQFKKQISPAHTSAVAPVQEKARKEEEQIDDTTLFQSALQGVQRLDHSNVVQRAKPAKPKKPDAQTIAKRIAAEGITDHDGSSALSDTQAALNPVGSQQTLSYRITTLQNKVFEDLKLGKMRWFEAVDLHGCTIEQARAAVLEIIHLAQQDNQNVIKIVHGKGPDAVLKTYVNGWLRQHRDVLAFVSAPENQGGTGAVLVLLKRAEKNPKFQPE